MANRFFNTAGPVNPNDHYCLSPLERINLNDFTSFIEQKKYFVLHAPRQTGKTSTLLALMEYLNNSGKYRCLYVNVEAAQAAREDVNEGIKAILGRISSQAKNYLNDDFVDKNWKFILEKHGSFTSLAEILELWSKASPLPLILLMDEIDALVGDTLISVLRQLRSGYTSRPAAFPQSIIFCGIRDVHDYRIHSTMEKAIITGGSCFNIKSESLRLCDFHEEDIKNLLLQHTKETGQIFEETAIQLVWYLTSGQPWLVNALAYEVCFKMAENRDRTKVITAEMIEHAKENIILRRETHIDQLADKLKEERVKNVITPMISGQDMENATEDDIQYVVDLGLVCKTRTGMVIANPIYREVIPRHLTLITQEKFNSREDPVWYIDEKNGRLNIEKLLTSFQQFFRENSESWMERFQYKEAGPQLLLQAFLQRIVNGGGRIEREYGLGRMRTDLLIIWHHPTGIQKVVIELKILYKTLEKTITEGLSQTTQYMDRSNADDGHLVIFDRRKGKAWSKKIFRKTREFNGKKIVIWGM